MIYSAAIQPGKPYRFKSLYSIPVNPAEMKGYIIVIITLSAGQIESNKYFSGEKIKFMLGKQEVGQAKFNLSPFIHTAVQAVRNSGENGNDTEEGD